MPPPPPPPPPPSGSLGRGGPPAPPPPPPPMAPGSAMKLIPAGMPEAAMDKGRLDMMDSLKGNSAKRLLKPVPR